MKQKTEAILRTLQKHFRGEWPVYIEDLTMVTLAVHCVWDAGWGAFAGGKEGLAGPQSHPPPGDCPKRLNPVSLAAPFQVTWFATLQRVLSKIQIPSCESPEDSAPTPFFLTLKSKLLCSP